MKKFLYFSAFFLLSFLTGLSSEAIYIFDAGHGGADSGAIGLYDIYEKELNLSLTLALNDLAAICGTEHVLTRSIDDDTDGDVNDFHKRDDILARLAMGEELENAVFISIHMNYSTGARDRGFQVFFGNLSPHSEQLARLIYEAVDASGLANRMREVKRAPGSVYLMKKLTCPAVLVECGFISNEEDCVLLYDAEYREKLAFSLISVFSKKSETAS